MEMLPTDTLIYPADTENTSGLLDGILACAERHGTKVSEIAESTRLDCGRIAVSVFRLAGDGKENERCLMARLSIGDEDLLVTADAPKRLERALAAQEDLSGTELLIAGHHGSKNACSEELLRAAGGKLAVISVGYNNYGHPAPETLERLTACGYTVKRTDRDGTVEIRLGRNHG
jgi:Predicted hydrolase (metallo-beta-lactamase superfamily)